MAQPKRSFFVALAALCTLPSCGGLFYYPSPELFADPAQFNVKPEDVSIESPSGARLHGWYFRSRAKTAPLATVVFFHGNAENLSSHYLNLLWLIDYPYDFLIFDYQGYGRSPGSPSARNTVEDGRAVLRYAHSRAPKRPLVVLGQSLGGNVALRAAVEEKDSLPIKFVAVDSTFSSYRAMGAKALSRGWLTWPLRWLAYLLLSDEYAPRGKIASLSPIPLLVIHGKEDGVVEFDQGEKVFAEAAEPKEFWAISGGHHTDVFSSRHGSAYRKKFVEAIERAIGGTF